MIRKLQVFLLCLFIGQTTFSQAPGPDCTSPVPLTLVPGATISTGQQTTQGLGNAYNSGAYTCAPIPTWFGSGEDGVYIIDVVIGGDYTFNLLNSYGTNLKALGIFSGCPNTAGNCVGGIYTASAIGGTATYTLTPGTYYIFIDDHAAPNYAEFILEITSPAAPPENNDCSGAIELYSNVNCLLETFTNVAATDSGELPLPGCASYSTGDVWFTYEVNSTGELTIETNNTVIDTGIAVYSGTCGSLSLIECDDDDGAFPIDSSITLTGRTPGEILYIRVWDFFDGEGAFDICLTTPVPAGTNGVNMNCPGETPRELTSDIGLTCGAVVGTTSLGNTISGSLNAATDPVAPRPESAANNTTCLFSANTSNYTTTPFTVTETGTYIFEMTSGGFDGMGYIVETGFTPGVCGAGFVIRDDDSGVGLLPQMTVNLTTGVNYILITTVFGFSSTTVSGAYTWNVSFPVSTPAPDWFTVAAGGTAIGSGDGFNPVGVAGSGLPDTNTPGIYSFWAECPLNPGVRQQADFVIGKTWTGATNTNWNTGSNWTQGTAPTDEQCVCIEATANDPIIGDNINADGYDITVKTGASLTLVGDTDTSGFGSSLTLQDKIDVQGTGTLTVQDGASLIQVLDSGVNTGNITLSRDTDIRRTDYVYWSSPVQGFDVSNVYAGFTPTNYIYEWIPTVATGTFAPGVLPTGGMPICYGTWSGLSSGTMTQGKGYIVRGPTNHTTTVSTATSTFTGVPNNGEITQPISSGDNSFAYSNYTYNPYGDILTVTPFDDNWNLLGNPYPSALDAQSFLTHPDNSIIEGAVHIWTHGTQIGANGESFYDDFLLTYDVNDYTTYNFSGTNTYADETFGGKIASGQGFFVLALNDNESGSVTFNNSMRDRTHSNTVFYRNSDPNTQDTNAIERHRIWLNLIDDSENASSIMVGYIEGATQEKDRLYDAYLREVNNLSIYSKIDDERMIIQGRSLPFNEADQIPLGTVLPDPGQYTIAISGVDGLFLNNDQNIYLEDTYTNVIHNLKASPYTFTVDDAIDYGDRFILRYTDDTLSINEFELNGLSIIAPKGNYIKVTSSSNTIDSVVVYDLLGRTMYNQTGIGASEFTVQNPNLSSGSYIVKATLNNGIAKTQKVILKR
ncbi:T9SS sorting signal type C domain-containing protein [Psychroserpens sp. XS_ASV72]|uniref:T9SS sorting signal type C domain-containing protein n=1 Tax=Psychroserpens sp. XS_ASV72 TaxID=3241293 RepID=UPI00351969C3